MIEVNIGIDLGTTNSSIVGFDENDFRVYKNRYQMEVTPSAVMIGKNNRLIIGQKAYESYSMNPNDVKLEFKRLMGTKESVFFETSQKYMTPEELSSEILKSLISDAQKFYESQIVYAVITIPAAFKAMQCESTNKAARLAGLSECALLMEPVAASVGFAGNYFDVNNKWLVYDFGGGTFDVAVVSHENNMLSVLEHSGNNMLGGKNIDDKIIDDILISHLQDNYNVPDKSHDINNYLNLKRRLKNFAETLKIELSVLEETKVDLYDIGRDLDGKEYDLNISINRKEVEKIAQPFIQETVYYCNEVMENAGLEANALSKVLLVGGPTQMPILRETLAEEFDIPLDFSIDPMTAVAKGAALYCSTLERPTKMTRSHIIKEDHSLVELTLSYQKVSSVIDPLIIGEISKQSNVDNYYEVCFEGSDGVWNSNWIPITDDKFETNLQLIKESSNQFNITMRDKSGKKIQCTPQVITIRHGVEFDDFKLPHTISIKVRGDDGNDFLEPIFPRNTTLPQKKVKTYAATKTLLPGSNDSIDILMYEGEIIESPEANDLLSNISIKGNEIQRPIPINTPINIIFNISNSRILKVTAYVEILNKEFVNRYIPDEGQYDVNTLYARANSQLDSAYEDILDLCENKDSLLNETEIIELDSLRDRADTIFIETKEITEIDKKVDPDKIKRVHADVNKLNQRLHKIKQKVKLNIEQDLHLLVAKFEESADEVRVLLDADDNRQYIPQFNRVYNDAKICFENDNIIGFRKCFDEMDKIKWQLRMQNEQFLKGAFEYFESIRAILKNQMEADRLFISGQEHISEGDYNSLRKVIDDLYDLLPDKSSQNEAYRSGIKNI